MEIINTKPEDAERIIRSFLKKKTVSILLFIILIVPILLVKSYPELLIRTIIGISLLTALFFGFMPNEILCKTIYRELGLGCPKRYVAILISLLLYVFAIYISFKTNII